MSLDSSFLHFRRWVIALASLIALPLFAATAAITDEECETYGKQLAEYFSSGKQSEVVRQLDTFAFMDKVTADLGFDEKELGEFRSGMLSGLSKSLVQNFSTFTSAQYLRAQSVGGAKRVLVRCVSEEGAVNYFAFIVDRRATGSLKWVDVYIYLTGETMTESTRRAVLPMVANMKKNLLDKLTSRESDYVQNFPKMTRATQLIQGGKFAEALAELERLPETVKRERFVLTLRLRAAQPLSEAEYLKVITAWEKAYPDDPSLDLISIDGDVMRKDYAGAIKRIDSLSQRLGGDNYLNFLKGNMQMMAGDNDVARLTARAVLAAEPTLTSAWDTLLTISLNEHKYAETVALLIEFEAKFPGAKMKPVIATNAAYADFRTTQEYRDWADQPEAGK